MVIGVWVAIGGERLTSVASTNDISSPTLSRRNTTGSWPLPAHAAQPRMHARAQARTHACARIRTHAPAPVHHPHAPTGVFAIETRKHSYTNVRAYRPEAQVLLGQKSVIDKKKWHDTKRIPQWKHHWSSQSTCINAFMHTCMHIHTDARRDARMHNARPDA